MADIRFVTKFLFNMKHDKNFYIINNENNLYTCNICNKYTTPYKVAMARHLKAHEINYSFDCVDCKKSINVIPSSNNFLNISKNVLQSSKNVNR
jgi:Pyruvate/2-oxoacid:ferredoxin oxidoreductase delta subunit